MATPTSANPDIAAPTKMDRASATWTRAFYAPLVFRQAPTQAEYREFGWEVYNVAEPSFEAIEGIQFEGFLLSDAAVTVHFLCPNSPKRFTASAHPLQFRERFSDDLLNPIPESVRDEFFEAVETIWTMLVDDFRWLASQGRLQILARINSPVAAFTEIAPDAFEHFKMTDWNLGVAQAPNGDQLYSIHAQRYAVESEVVPTAPERDQRRTTPVIARAQKLIAIAFPGGVPDMETLTNKELCRRIADEAKRQQMPLPSDDTILRAAGRRQK
jgi:hypothetical protein